MKGLVDYGSESDDDDQPQSNIQPIKPSIDIAAAPVVNQTVNNNAINKTAVPIKLSALQKLKTDEKQSQHTVQHVKNPFSISLMDPDLDQDHEGDDDIDQSDLPETKHSANELNTHMTDVSSMPNTTQASSQSINTSSSQSNKPRLALPLPSQLLSGVTTSKQSFNQTISQSLKPIIPATLDAAAHDEDADEITSQSTFQSITHFVPMQVASKRSNINIEDHAGFNNEKRVKR